MTRHCDRARKSNVRLFEKTLKPAGKRLNCNSGDPPQALPERLA
jgi:hypothetical protein